MKVLGNGKAPPAWVSPGSQMSPGGAADQREVLIELYRSSSAQAARSSTFFITNPSNRISCYVEVFFEPDNPVTGPFGWVNTDHYWTLTAQALPAARNAFCPLHILEESDTTNELRMLPRAYELDSQTRAVRLDLVTRAPTINGSSLNGSWYIRGRWEPNVAGMDENLVKLLLSRCKLTGAVL